MHESSPVVAALFFIFHFSELRALRAEVRSMGQIAALYILLSMDCSNTATVETIDLSAGETLVRIVAGTHPWLVCRIMGAIV